MKGVAIPFFEGICASSRQVFEKGRKGADQPQGFQTMLVNTLKCGCSHGMRNELTKRKWLAKEEKKGLSWERTVSFSQKEVSVRMISTPCIEIQTTSENRFSVPAWFRSRRHHSWLPGEERAT